MTDELVDLRGTNLWQVEEIQVSVYLKPMPQSNCLKEMLRHSKSVLPAGFKQKMSIHNYLWLNIYCSDNEATFRLNRLKELLADDYFGAKFVCATQRVSIWLNFGPPTTFLCHIWLNFGSLAHFCVTAGRLLTVRISLSPMASIFPSFSLQSRRAPFSGGCQFPAEPCGTIVAPAPSHGVVWYGTCGATSLPPFPHLANSA